MHCRSCRHFVLRVPKHGQRTPLGVSFYIIYIANDWNEAVGYLLTFYFALKSKEMAGWVANRAWVLTGGVYPQVPFYPQASRPQWVSHQPPGQTHTSTHKCCSFHQGSNSGKQGCIYLQMADGICSTWRFPRVAPHNRSCECWLGD